MVIHIAHPQRPLQCFIESQNRITESFRLDAICCKNVSYFYISLSIRVSLFFHVGVFENGGLQ